jgi:dihydrofolate synthase/folylpolyglutamate synthase
MGAPLLPNSLSPIIEYPRSSAILERLLALHPKKIDLALDRILRLLAELGNPHLKLPPVIHVAGTNGKGSACAFSRAMLEAQGLKVHTHISPHLVRFHERIRLAGELISEDELCATLEEVERVNDGEPITFFEITAAAMFLAFSRHPADAVVLEVGLGGKYDATNVIPRPAMTIIQPVGLDHIEFLGSDIATIAGEKAGIIKRGVPVVVGPQDEIAREVILRRADSLSAPAFVFGQDFFARQEHGRMVYEDEMGLLDLPLPRLIGRHQIDNSGVAIAGLRHAMRDSRSLNWGADAAVERGLRTVDWPGRLQHITHGPLIADAPNDSEIWLDGGHNSHGAAAISRAIADLDEKVDRPLYLICGMLKTKDAVGFLSAFKGLARHVVTVSIPGEAASLGAGALYDAARQAGLDAAPSEDLEDAMLQVGAWARAHPKEPPPRILICGSLYLAGKVLAENG